MLFFNILDLKKYNTNGLLVNCKNENDVFHNIINLNPLVINYKNDYKYDELILNKGDHLENLDLTSRNSINIEKDKSLLHIFDRGKIPGLIESKVPLLDDGYISVYKNHTTELKQCFSNHTMLYIIDGNTKIYIFNPKHKEDIKDKPLNSIKKWAHIRELKKGDLAILPTNWFYITENTDYSIMYVNYINNIFTFIPNYIRENYIIYKDYLKVLIPL